MFMQLKQVPQYGKIVDVTQIERGIKPEATSMQARPPRNYTYWLHLATDTAGQLLRA